MVPMTIEDAVDRLTDAMQRMTVEAMREHGAAYVEAYRLFRVPMPAVDFSELLPPNGVVPMVEAISAAGLEMELHRRTETLARHVVANGQAGRNVVLACLLVVWFEREVVNDDRLRGMPLQRFLNTADRIRKSELFGPLVELGQQARLKEPMQVVVWASLFAIGVS
jgi:hypothetical protein